MSFPLTPEQRAVVENRDGGLLVSAAAGSGKTRVLVERLLARVEGEGLDIDRFLVITYTKAAAAELRGRIADELALRLAQRPTDRHLRRQTTLVYKAQISTIHAFCAQLLRECGHRLALDPDFRLCDEGEAGVIMLRAMDAVLEKRYEEIDPEGDFAQLLDTMSAGRDDNRLVQIALDIYSKVQSHPDPHAWLDHQSAAFGLAGISDVGATPWGALLLEDARRQGIYWRGQITRALELAQGDEKLANSYAPSLVETLEALCTMVDSTGKGWDKAAEWVEIPFSRLGAVRNCEDPLAQAQIKAIRDKCKKRMAKVAELLSDSSAQLIADMRAVYPAVGGLFSLVEDFAAAYAAEKNRRGLLDFSDLEHFAVTLLTGTDATELAETVAARYCEVMVDEYQDTNEVQNAIFNAVSRGGTNLFMVGDVKQSIYRFRLADPTIFLRKYRTFKAHTQAAEGENRRIVLSKNFRSRGQILEGVNFVFRNVMSMGFGEMDYTEDEALHVGATYTDEGQERYAVELNALDLSVDDSDGDTGDGEKLHRDVLEARFIAERIQTLLDEKLSISDGEGGTRPVEAGDIVILLRSPNAVLPAFARALGERNLPWEADAGGDFFASTEVSVALSLLQVLDNPRQDVPLLSVLRSPVYAFTADRLAQLRAKAGDVDFYGALEQGAAEGAVDCAAFLREIEELRNRAEDMSCRQLLWALYDRTNLLGVFDAMGDGETRRGNLLALCNCARTFEDAGHKGLFGFLTHLERLRESGNRLTAAAMSREGGGVRILSIHKSKGLEFPVVFLAGLMRQFNREDMKKPMLFHPVLGVGPKGLDVARMVEYPTLARRGVARKQEMEMMAEELRLLYVAMTRAREKLILVCSLTGGGADLQKLGLDAGCPTDPQALLTAQSVGQWVLLPVLARPDGAALRRGAEMLVDLTPEDCGPWWDVRWVDGGYLRKAGTARRVEKPKEEVQGDERTLAARLSWRYPHAGVTEIPSKLTATQLKGRLLDEEAAAETPRPPQSLRFERPAFMMEEQSLTAAQKGTALHLVMQYLDFAKTGSAAEIAGEIQRLTALQILSPQQGAAADPEKLAAFFASELGREMRGAEQLHREYKFSILVPAKDYYGAADGGETVLLQGVVDCWFETEHQITVLDFKTDRVKAETVAEKAEEYRPQLMAYSRALEEVTGKTVVRRMLWFFGLGCAVEV